MQLKRYIGMMVVSLASFNASANEFTTIESLKNMIRQKNVSTLDELLPTLPETYRRRYTLVYKTRGLGKSSLKHPRVILSGERNALTLSFDTDHRSPLYQTLEVMQYDGLKDTFSFTEIRFDKPVPTEANGFERISALSDDVFLSKNNPRRCMTCHEKPISKIATPIWDLYPMWPGVYGSVEDAHTFRANISEHEPVTYGVSFEQKAYDRWIKPKIDSKDPQEMSRLKYLLPIWQQEEKWRFRTGMGLADNFTYLSNRSNLAQFKKHIGETWHHVKYPLYYAVQCIPEALRPSDYDAESWLSKLETYVSIDQVDKMISSLGQSAQKLETRVRDQILKKQDQVFHRLCVGHRHLKKCEAQMRTLLGPAPNDPTPYPKDVWSDAYGFLDLRSQWSHVATLATLLGYLHYPYEEWVHDFSHNPTQGVGLSYYSNNANAPHGLNDVVPAMFDVGRVNPKLDQDIIAFYQEYLHNPWPFLSDFSSSMPKSGATEEEKEIYQQTYQSICERVQKQSLASRF